MVVFVRHGVDYKYKRDDDDYCKALVAPHNGTHPMPILVPTHDRHEERMMFFLKHSECLYAVLLNFSFKTIPSHLVRMPLKHRR